MLNPYELAGDAAPGLLVISGAVTVFMIAVLFVMDKKLKTDAAPQGMISFELRATADRSLKIVQSWRQHPDGTDRVPLAGRILYLDFLLIIGYVCFLTLLWGSFGKMANAHGCQFLGTLLAIIAWLQVVAGILDVIENICLLTILNKTTLRSSSLPRTACLCATIKFVLLGAAYFPLKTYRQEGFFQERTRGPK